MILTPKNWSSFQHYKDRSPAWIKLHRGLLDDYDYSRLPLASRALAPLLWLLASEYEGGKITASPAQLAFRLHTTEKELAAALNPLIENGFFISDSAVLADCKRNASLEKEKEERKRREDIRTVATATRPTQFQNFKIAYPKRKGGNPWPPAEKLFDAAIKSGASADHMIAALRAGVGFDRDKIGTEYIPQAQKWLRDRRWEDHQFNATAQPARPAGAPSDEELRAKYGPQHSGISPPRETACRDGQRADHVGELQPTGGIVRPNIGPRDVPDNLPRNTGVQRLGTILSDSFGRGAAPVHAAPGGPSSGDDSADAVA